MADEALRLPFREVLWDDHLMDTAQGVSVHMHTPRREGAVFRCGESWEGNTSGYFQIFRDGPGYRLYYRGADDSRDGDGRKIGGTPGRFCAAESPDGVHFSRPSLGVVSWRGTGSNNILFDREMDNIFIFRDLNPDCPEEERYKGLCGEFRQALMLYTSPDGARFSETGHRVMEGGNFDSLNTCFWNPVFKRYDLYYRVTRPPRRKDGPERNAEGHVRDIYHAVSPDFVHWTEKGPIDFGPDAPDFQMYTNNIMPYPRAPHIYIGWPARYTERRMDKESIPCLPDWPVRRGLIEEEGRSGTAMTDTMLMISRDGQAFSRRDEAFLRPGPERPGRWTYGDMYMAYGMAEALNPVTGDEEISLYATENYRVAPTELIRYTLRQDGFFSWRAPWREGRVLTRPLILPGDQMSLNFSTSAQGYVRIRVLDGAGEPIPNLDSGYLFGDALRRDVPFRGALSQAAGRPVRLEFVMSDADVYSVTFRDACPPHLR